MKLTDIYYWHSKHIYFNKKKLKISLKTFLIFIIYVTSLIGIQETNYYGIMILEVFIWKYFIIVDRSKVFYKREHIETSYLKFWPKKCIKITILFFQLKQKSIRTYTPKTKT